MLTVIAIIGTLMGIGVGVAGLATRKARDAATKGQMQTLITAIESYKSSFGSYPPDNGSNRSLNVSATLKNPLVTSWPQNETVPAYSYYGAWNPLYYELMGCMSKDQGASYLAPDGATWFPSSLFAPFNIAGIQNSAEGTDKPKGPFLPGLTASQYKPVQVGAHRLEVLVAPLDWRELQMKGSLGLANGRLSPWCYNSSNPAYNSPGSFDLWVETSEHARGTIIRKKIGNWKE